MRRFLILALLVLSGTLSASYLSSSEIEQYYKQGYFVKKAALSAEVVSELDLASDLLLDRVLDELSKDTYPEMASNQTTYIDGTQIVFVKKENSAPSIKRMVGCGSIEPSFMNVLRSKKMVETYFALLGTNAIEQLVCQFHPKVPGDGVHFVKHRDMQYRKAFDPKWEDLGENGSYAVCIIAIDPMSEDNGGLVIDKKSYPVADGSDIEALTMEPGDMLFMHPEILHWSEANLSTIRRRVLLAGYCVYGANHRNYPGNCTNDVISKASYQVEPAPWKVMDDESF
ncbi:MAG: hypothetical protein SP4CHLAM1_17500 [Chlamydiia bacterium]|nr:hypothetical protein [Chlamydiia bacterium]MCH9629951.1 hypothetical protein [Chlamydiia bacterium]